LHKKRLEELAKKQEEVRKAVQMRLEEKAHEQKQPMQQQSQKPPQNVSVSIL